MAHTSSPLPVASLPTGTLTFLFTDIEGSSRLWEQHPQAMLAALARHDAILHDAIHAHRGVVFKTAGDGVHAVFARAADALIAVIAAQHALCAEPWHVFMPIDSTVSNIQHPQSTIALRVRMGLHSGVAEERTGDYFGPALNRVARILDLGHGGQVLLSHTTYDLVADDLPEQIALRALGEYQLKDLTRPEQIFQLTGPDLPSAFPPLRTVVTAPVAAAAPPAQLLTTKLYVPSTRSNLVPRQHLIDRLHAGLGDLYREWNDLDSAEQLLIEGMHRAIGAVTTNAVYLRQGCFALARLQHARGDHAHALATLKILADLGRQRAFDPLVLAQGVAVQVRLALAEGQLETAIHWADTSGLHADDVPSFPRELEHLTLARVLIAKGRGDPRAPGLHEALHLLDRLLDVAEAAGRMRSVIEIAMLRALALAAQGDLIGARTALERALTLAAPEGYIRTFVDEGAPMAALLRTELRGLRTESLPRGYIERLLNAFDQPRAVDPQSSVLSPPSSPLVEPLSEHELAIGSQSSVLSPPSSPCKAAPRRWRARVSCTCCSAATLALPLALQSCTPTYTFRKAKLHTPFGRITPQQKQQLVRTLRRFRKIPAGTAMPCRAFPPAVRGWPIR